LADINEVALVTVNGQSFAGGYPSGFTALGGNTYGGGSYKSQTAKGSYSPGSCSTNNGPAFVISTTAFNTGSLPISLVQDTYVASNSNASGTIPLSLSGVTVGDWLIITVGTNYSGAYPTIATTSGTTSAWTTKTYSYVNSEAAIYFAVAQSTSVTVTLTLPGAALWQVGLMEFSGIYAFDQIATGGSNSGQTILSGLTTTRDCELIVGALGWSAGAHSGAHPGDFFAIPASYNCGTGGFTMINAKGNSGSMGVLFPGSPYSSALAAGFVQAPTPYLGTPGMLHQTPSKVPIHQSVL
jgi:hypothetical protein